jgi:phosphinothricin acetyltransferase
VIRLAKPADAAAIIAIYNHYIETSTISFEEEPVSVEVMAQRIEDVNNKFAWYVYEHEGRIAGYAYATAWRVRRAYRLSVESSVYVSKDYPKLGIGSALYRHLLDDLKKRGISVVIGGIALPNPASIALHEKIGFEKVAHFKKVGRKFEKWIDVGYWQLVFE